MSAFIPTLKGKLIKAADEFTVSGSRLFAAPIPIGLSVVTLKTSVGHTSVRSDTSGSQSYADQEVEAGRVLIHPKVTPGEDDLVEINGQTFRISGVQPRYTLNGKIDHYQVELGTWASA